MKYSDIKSLLKTLTSPAEKLEFVMDLGKTLQPVPKKAKCTEILGCSSFVQICELNNKYYGHADSLMVAGIVAILLSIIQDKTKVEIKKMDLLTEFNGLDLTFGSARLTGIQSMVNFFKNL
ncbi:MAG: SufE family protein [Alphaproteobacteria bacterium]|nr:SufE family protein [Alphaproteobacteria bacterium]